MSKNSSLSDFYENIEKENSDIHDYEVDFYNKNHTLIEKIDYNKMLLTEIIVQDDLKLYLT